MRKLRGSKGVTFVELIVTVAILGSALVILLKFFVDSMNLNALSRDVTLAVSHAQYVLEDIRSSSGVIKDQIDSGVWNLNTDVKFTNSGLLRIYNEAINVSDDSGTPLTITVVITWQEDSGRQEQLTFVTVDAGV
jgi:prepilin-type N-terminal cleavage/methylation domain-containing protein